ncbi:unnamed protein product [Meganyctiphanes norvegica]|uniref:Uncharacterized protein n=1 Tax=Meganyctiphanes norvegica TaxID=48144 RepID=A0AAV2SYB9_MEGNR
MGVYGSLVRRPGYYFISPALDGTSRTIILLLKVLTRHILASTPSLYQGSLITNFGLFRTRRSLKGPLGLRFEGIWLFDISIYSDSPYMKKKKLKFFLKQLGPKIMEIG